MSPFGTRLAVIEEVVRQTSSDWSMSEPDIRLLADRLDTAARQVRAIGECREADALSPPLCRSTPKNTGAWR